MTISPIQAVVSDAGRRLPFVTWSVCLRARSGGVLAELGADRRLSTASVGKLLLLAEVARQVEAGELEGDLLLSRQPSLMVGDSGLWQHLRADALSVADLAVLIASVSDNLATNVLLDHVGLGRVQALADEMGLCATALLDRVRDDRSPDDPPMLSVGTAGELSRLMMDVVEDKVVSPAVSRRLADWMSLGVDMSMVASAFGLDPLAHTVSDRGVLLRNKTGTDIGVRADVGVVTGSAGTVAYAVIANWAEGEVSVRDEVLSVMRDIGTQVLRGVCAGR
ncbi:serine hydrolase [Nocardia alni]|uniref:serine hydrolase n=1 Tax=Nocardia alni TaxID=2815723 RepID=UPI001C24A059|nr:serine hydrolase [Nocardia alni]